MQGSSERLGSITAASKQIRRICQQLWPGYHTEGLRRKQAKWLKVQYGRQCRRRVNTNSTPVGLPQGMGVTSASLMVLKACRQEVHLLALLQVNSVL